MTQKLVAQNNKKGTGPARQNGNERRVTKPPQYFTRHFDSTSLTMPYSDTKKREQIQRKKIKNRFKYMQFTQI